MENTAACSILKCVFSTCFIFALEMARILVIQDGSQPPSTRQAAVDIAINPIVVPIGIKQELKT
jgi:hypothetical protein